MRTIRVAIIMGSDSDLPVMQEAIDVLEDLKISYEVKIVSAHRTPNFMIKYAQGAKKRGFKVIIAGAGGAAHLPGMVASTSLLPVIGVPIRLNNTLEGIDSLLSIVQMPSGVPVATMAVNNAKNAGLFAARLLALSSPSVYKALEKFQAKQKLKVTRANQKLLKKKNEPVP